MKGKWLWRSKKLSHEKKSFKKVVFIYCPALTVQHLLEEALGPEIYGCFGGTCCFHLQGRRLLSTVIMTARSSTTSVNLYQISLRYITEDNILLSWLSLGRSFNQNYSPDTSVTWKKLLNYLLPNACRY
jgi:hypothetical protein